MCEEAPSPLHCSNAATTRLWMFHKAQRVTQSVPYMTSVQPKLQHSCSTRLAAVRLPIRPPTRFSTNRSGPPWHYPIPAWLLLPTAAQSYGERFVRC